MGSPLSGGFCRKFKIVAKIGGQKEVAGSIWGLGMFWNVPEWERASPGSFRGWGPARLSACLQGRAPARTPAPRQPSFYQAGNWFCDLWNVDRRNPYIACLIFSKLKRNVLGDHFQNKFLSFSWRQTFKQGERCSKFLKFLKLFKFEKVKNICLCRRWLCCRCESASNSLKSYLGWAPRAFRLRVSQSISWEGLCTVFGVIEVKDFQVGDSNYFWEGFCTAHGMIEVKYLKIQDSE